VVKLTKELNVEWMKLLGGAGWDEAADVKEVEDGYNRSWIHIIERNRWSS